MMSCKPTSVSLIPGHGNSDLKAKQDRPSRDLPSRQKCTVVESCPFSYLMTASQLKYLNF
jgi:hypothetical protein